MKLLDQILQRKTKIHVVAKTITAARVIYEDAEVQRMEIRIELPEKEILILELTSTQARELGHEMVAAIQAMGYEFKVRR